VGSSTVVSKMKLNVKASVELDVELKDVLAFVITEDLTEPQMNAIVQEVLRKKKGFYSMEDQMKFEIFEREKEKWTATELEQRLTAVKLS